MSGSGLEVVVTGPTGTFGEGLVPLLEAAPAVGEVVGVARSPFDPAERGWHKMTYRQGDVRDPDLLAEAFEGADVVVHLAFIVVGNASAATIRAINVDGTINVFRAAAAVCASRFVYASSLAAYGFHPDNPVGMDEDWPRRPAERFFYAQEKAELEALLEDEAEAHPEVDLYLLRPPVVLGPHAVGGKGALLERIVPLLGAAGSLVRRSPVPLPALAPELPMQFIHEDDVGTALLQCVLGAGPPGAYNIAGDGVVTPAEMARELGLRPIGVPGAPVAKLARGLAALPYPGFVPPVAGWAEALSHPAVMDTTKAKEQLGWAPRYSGIEAFRSMLTR